MARFWYQKAADHRLAEAEMNLAEMLIKGLGGPVDVSKAELLLKSAADQARHF